MLRGHADFSHGAMLTRLQGTSRLCIHIDLLCGRLPGRKQRFDLNALREFGAEGQARIAYLANDIGISAQKLNRLFFDKTEFSQTIAGVDGAVQSFDAHGGAGYNAA